LIQHIEFLKLQEIDCSFTKKMKYEMLPVVIAIATRIHLGYSLE